MHPNDESVSAEKSVHPVSINYDDDPEVNLVVQCPLEVITIFQLLCIPISMILITLPN